MSASSYTPPLPSPSRLAARRALHARVVQVERLIGPSQVAYMRGEPKRWTEAELAVEWRRAAENARPGTHNNVYVHVPFCKSICAFCNYDRLKPSNPAALRAWRDRVLASIGTLAPAVGALEFHSLYFGGGTPSVLPSAILREVFTALDQSFRWHKRASRSIELDPAMMNRSKAEAMLDHGFHHFSFGVQTQSAAVNEAHNRGPQGPEMVARCLDQLPGPWLGTVTADILLGLAGTTPDDTLRDIERLICHPRRPAVDVFHLSPTREYVASHFGGSRAAASAALSRYDADFDARLHALCKTHGYHVLRGGSHHARTLAPRPGGLLRRPDTWRSQASLLRGDLRRVARRVRARRPVHFRRFGRLPYTQLATAVRKPLNLLGLGPSARSQVFGAAAVQTRPHAGHEGPTAYEGHAMSAIDELRTFVIFDIRDEGVVYDADLIKVFGMSLAEALPEALAVWIHDGFAQRVPGGWLFERGRPEEVARAVLWAVSDAALEGLVQRKSGRRKKSKPAPRSRRLRSSPQ